MANRDNKKPHVTEQSFCCGSSLECPYPVIKRATCSAWVEGGRRDIEPFEGRGGVACETKGKSGHKTASKKEDSTFKTY